tara:strand:+ start:2704 stop:3207 length:504 start_codon:yes stop_codon:yes gene_type:complete
MFNLFKKNFYINLFIVISIFVLDRITKIYVIHLNGKNYGQDLFNSKFLNISLIWNEGIAFGLFSFTEKNFYHFLTLLIGIVIIIIVFMIKNNEGIKKYSLLMILGGAIGNFYDRIFFNAVPDFIDFHIENFHWFIFNVSDIFITLGVILMIVLEVFSNKREQNNEKT